MTTSRERFQRPSDACCMRVVVVVCRQLRAQCNFHNEEAVARGWESQEARGTRGADGSLKMVGSSAEALESPKPSMKAWTID